MSDSCKLSVYFFAQSRELAGTSNSSLILPQKADPQTIRSKLLEAFPRLKELKNCFVLALNEEYLEDQGSEITLSATDKLAVIPPLSGG